MANDFLKGLAKSDAKFDRVEDQSIANFCKRRRDRKRQSNSG